MKIRVFLWRHRGSISHRLDWGKLEATSPPGRSWGFSPNLIDQLAPPTSTNTGIWMNKCPLIYYSQEESPKGFVVSWKIINVLFVHCLDFFFFFYKILPFCNFLAINSSSFTSTIHNVFKIFVSFSMWHKSKNQRVWHPNLFRKVSAFIRLPFSTLCS